MTGKKIFMIVLLGNLMLPIYSDKLFTIKGSDIYWVYGRFPDNYLYDSSLFLYDAFCVLYQQNPGPLNLHVFISVETSPFWESHWSFEDYCEFKLRRFSWDKDIKQITEVSNLPVPKDVKEYKYYKISLEKGYYYFALLDGISGIEYVNIYTSLIDDSKDLKEVDDFKYILENIYIYGDKP